MPRANLIAFLQSLDRVPHGEHPPSPEKCPCCHLLFGEIEPATGFAEYAVKLPCSGNHVVGIHCIAKWLSPSPLGASSNTCPLCRFAFFDPWPRRTPATNSTARHAPQAANPPREYAMIDAGYNPRGWIDPQHGGQERGPLISENRGQAAVHEREFYTALVVRGVRFPSGMDRLLDPRQDHALFDEIQRRGGFRSLALNEEMRVDLFGRTLSNREIYEQLRSLAVYWNFETERWCTIDGNYFAEEGEDESAIFEELAIQGALRTPGINSHFRGVSDMSDYCVYRNLVQMGVTWHRIQRVWVDRNGVIQFGDRVNERTQPRGAAS